MAEPWHSYYLPTAESAGVSWRPCPKERRPGARRAGRGPRPVRAGRRPKKWGKVVNTVRQQRNKAIREIIIQKLQAGEIINPDEIAQQVDLVVGEAEAKALWRRSYVSRAVHTEARRLGLIAVSLGPGNGLKAATSEEDLALAKSRATAQVKGQATRGKHLLEKLRLLNQLTFPLEGVMSDVNAVSEPAPVAATSA